MPGVTSQGAKFYYASTSVATSIEGIELPQEQEIADVTNLDSTAREYLALGLMNNGEVTLTLTFDAANTSHAAMETLRDAGTSQAMKITLPKGGVATATYSFNGIIKNISPSAQVGTKQTASATVAVNGAVTKT
jgi:hypothetical protein